MYEGAMLILSIKPNVGFAHNPTVVVGFALLHPPYGYGN